MHAHVAPHRRMAKIRIVTAELLNRKGGASAD